MPPNSTQNLSPWTPYLNSLDSLFWCFLFLFFFFSLFCPFCRTHPPQFSQSIVNPPASVANCLDSPPSVYFLDLNHAIIRRLSSRSPSLLLSFLLLLSGDIELNPGPLHSQPHLRFAHLNVRSAASLTVIDKPLCIQQLIIENSFDILALSETWLSSDTLPATLNSLTPPGFSIIHNPRLSGKGGGVGFIHRSSLTCTSLKIPTFPSFESLACKLSLPCGTFTVLVIYRPPSSSATQFFADFSCLLEEIAVSAGEIFITGDFNFHVDCPQDPHVSTFLTLLDDFNLSQHVSFPTHSANHTLDLFISNSLSNLVSSVDSLISAISDHFLSSVI